MGKGSQLCDISNLLTPLLIIISPSPFSCSIFTHLCSFSPKGDNVDVKAITESTVGVQQCFVVFDVLKINDDNLANCPLIERAEKLKE